MGDYKTYTNSELEDELERLKGEYEFVQNTALESYQAMLGLAQKYGEIKEILDTRNGKKKEEA